MRGTTVLPHYNVNILRPFAGKAHPKIRDMSKFADIEIDPAIVRRASKGDAKAHEIIYRAYSAPVYSVCLRFTRVPATAEDLLQETFIQVIRSIAGFRGEAPLGMWIRRIAISKALMFLRSAWHSRGQSLDDDWEDAAPAGTHQQGNPAQPEQAMDLDAALGNLPPVSRAVVWLHDVEGFTHKEIAGLMGKTESFSKSQLSRAYLRLRPMLDVQLERKNTDAAMQGSVLGSC
jgi:RNA polymerase sigma factor (sigma-70 family)